MRLALALLVLLTACVGNPPRERFFTLEAPEPPLAAEGAPSIAVGPVSVPDVVDRPQFVVRVGANQVALNEQARWAEPLKSAIARVVAANVASALSGRVVNARDSAVDHRVTLDVQRFESTPGDSVLIDATWTVVHENAQRRTGRSVASQKVAGKDYDALAAAHSAALAAISKEIAAAIQKP
jgi:uncharacterized lipoprotein YmbA